MQKYLEAAADADAAADAAADADALQNMAKPSASQQFLLAVREPAPPACSDARFARILKLASLLGHAAVDHAGRGVSHKNLAAWTRRDPGFYGIFSDHYKHVKTRFIFDALCAKFPATAARPPHVCELGFMKGQSAVLFLETHAASVVTSFDLGDFKWARGQAALLRAAYGAERFSAVFGPSNETVPERAAAVRRGRRGAPCDAALVDGDKSRAGRLADLRNVRELSAPNAMLFFDEATSFRCVASADECEAACEADRRLKSDLWGGATLSYCDAAKLRLLSMERCAWPPGMQDMDGVCLGRYV